MKRIVERFLLVSRLYSFVLIVVPTLCVAGAALTPQSPSLSCCQYLMTNINQL